MTEHDDTVCLRLVGSVLVSADDPHYAWFSETYARLLHEVGHAGICTRLVRYAGPAIQFAGLEVAHADDIPDGMLAWELGEHTWRVRDAAGSIIWQSPLTWPWRAISDTGRWVGEFAAASPQHWGGGASRFQITAHSYLVPGMPYDDEIILVDPDPAWPRQYTEFAACLTTALGASVVKRIEHYGSTAIPGIPAKPIIDVLLEVPSYDVARQRVLPLVNHESWELWWYSDHLIAIKREKLQGRRTHHLHLAPAGHRLWEGIAFRDYLIAHPTVADAYAKLKRELADTHREDREKYTQAKTAFVQEITAKALATGKAE